MERLIDNPSPMPPGLVVKKRAVQRFKGTVRLLRGQDLFLNPVPGQPPRESLLPTRYQAPEACHREDASRRHR